MGSSSLIYIFIFFFFLFLCQFSLLVRSACQGYLCIIAKLKSIVGICGKRKNSAKYMRKGFKRLKVEMEEIREEQQSIKEGYRQVREKFKAIEEGCEQLRKETNQINRQSANSQIRLALMFAILKAREQGDFTRAAQLTQLLRDIVARDDLIRLKVEMKEISKEQQSIKEGQWQVRAKSKANQQELQLLRQETNQLFRQSANTRIRLALMFHILKAREQGDFARAAQLTELLREIIAKDNLTK
ncbi:hypothetical protein CRYUN_Cryun26dG0128500 [Craigia yunnanensis]